ncbi:MAG: acyl carrier protein, partial [Paracoccus sp. (in: a-proteobacteria)]
GETTVMTELAIKLREFIAEDTGMELSEFNEDTELFSEGYIDSFTMTSVIGWLEEETGISIAQSAVTLENFDTINRMVAFVAREKG